MQGNPRQAKPAKSLLNIAAQIRKVSVTAGEVLYVPPFWSYTMLTEPTGLAWGMDILSPSAEQLNLLEAELQQLPFPPRVSNLTHVVSDDYEYEQLKTILQKHEAGEIEGEGEGEGEGRRRRQGAGQDGQPALHQPRCAVHHGQHRHAGRRGLCQRMRVPGDRRHPHRGQQRRAGWRGLHRHVRRAQRQLLPRRHHRLRQHRGRWRRTVDRSLLGDHKRHARLRQHR